MKVVILAGGYGTRIRDVDETLPKPMIPIGGIPILWHIMKYYAQWGHDQFVICLGYRGNVIKDFFLNYEAHTRDLTLTLGKNHSVEYHNDHAEFQWRVTLANTGLNAMTGARVKRVEKYLRSDTNFMLTYGDAVGDVDMRELIAFHLSHGKLLTVTGVRPPGRFGELACDCRGCVTEFNEKPQVAEGLISGGFFVCRQELFRYLDGCEELVFEKEPMTALVRDKQVMVYRHGGFWHPMDTSRDYQLLNTLWDQKKSAWKIW